MLGVCIKYFHENYGGMLQAFATTKIIEKYGIEYELIRYEKKKNLTFIIKSIPRIFNSILVNDKYEKYQKKLSFKNHPEFAEKDKTRMKAFDEFRTKNFKNLSEIYVGYDNLKQGAKKYTAVLTGSDQLWSPAGLPTNFYNLNFVADDIRKISYSSSFGVKYIPFYQKRRTANFLKRLDFISMRENSGQAIVKELTGKDVPVVLDPVFMLDKTEWEQLIIPKKLYKEKYIFAYFLGNNREHRLAVKELAERTKLKIVALRHLDQYVEDDETFGDYAPYNVGPDDFLNLLRDAEYVCTDSFHGSVFSIIHKKKFIVFNRYDNKSKHSKNSRIDTLCKNFGLEHCRYNGNIEEHIGNRIDYEKVDKKYDELKKMSKKYLDKALEGVT